MGRAGSRGGEHVSGERDLQRLTLRWPCVPLGGASAHVDVPLGWLAFGVALRFTQVLLAWPGVRPRLYRVYQATNGIDVTG